MLGVSIYGKEYTNLGEAMITSSIRLLSCSEVNPSFINSTFGGRIEFFNV